MNKKAQLIPVAVYLRMSSDDQRDSIERQQAEITAYCTRKGYTITATYRDDGKSASSKIDLDKRVQFLQMLADSTKATWKVIVTDNISRFGRLDSIDGAFAKQTLRANGCVLDTVQEGTFDWNSAADRWKDMALCEAAHSYARNLARDSVSGRMQAIARGEWPNGEVPYGYDRLYTDGATKQLVRRRQSFRKPRGWKRQLVRNEQEAETVRWVFATYTTTATGLRDLARQLTAKKVPTPDGGRRNNNAVWIRQTIAKMLRCEAYIGIGSIGVAKKARKVKFLATTPTRVEGLCPVIVDRPTWEAAQKKLERNGADGKKQQPTKCGLLSGFLVCGHCGKRLRKSNAVGSRKGKADYICEGTRLDPDSTCKQWRAWEEEVLPRVVSWIIEKVDAEVIARMQARPETIKVDEAAVLQTSIEALRKKLDRATTNFLEADAELVPALNVKLREMRAELQAAETRLGMVQATSQGGTLASFSAWWEGIKQGLKHEGKAKVYHGGGASGMSEQKEVPLYAMTREPATFRGFLDTIGLEVSVRWKEVTDHGRGRRYAPESLQITANVDWADNNSVATLDKMRYRLAPSRRS